MIKFQIKIIDVDYIDDMNWFKDSFISNQIRGRFGAGNPVYILAVSSSTVLPH